MTKTPPIRQTLAGMAGQLVAAACVAALLMSALGPAADHHFAERHPGHAHLYLGPQVPDHLHSYETRTAYSHSHGAHPDRSIADGVVYLTTHDGSGQGLSDVAAPAVSPSTVFPDPGDDHPYIGSADGESALRSAFVAPPERPPRA